MAAEGTRYTCDLRLSSMLLELTGEMMILTTEFPRERSKSTARGGQRNVRDAAVYCDGG